MLKLVFMLLSIMPVKRNLIVFESFSGKQYSCNPRAIYEYLLGHENGYQLIWSANQNVIPLFEKERVPYVKRLSFQWFFVVARANYWVTNSRMPSWVRKPSHTTYIQTWHGTPLKRLVADMEEVHMPGTTRDNYIRNFHRESSQWDYLISPNRYSTEIFRRAFHFNKEVIESGYPRNDALINKNCPEVISEIKKELKLPQDKKNYSLRSDVER